MESATGSPILDKLSVNINANTALVVGFMPVLEIFSVPDSNLLVLRQIERLCIIGEDDLLGVGVTDKRIPVPQTCIPR